MEENKIKVPERWKSNEMGKLIIERKKSALKVGDAANFGQFPFFTSGESILNHTHKIVEGENIYLATGGVANIKYFNGEAAYSTDTYTVSTNGEIETEYLYFDLLNIIDYINANYFQGSGLKHLQKKDLKKHIIAYPEKVTEQRQIACILSKVGEAISQTEKLIAKYNHIKIGLMQDLLTKGIDEYGNIRSEETHGFKHSLLGRIPVEWEVDKLSKIAKVSRGKFTPRPRNNPIYYGGIYPFIQTGDISNCNNLYLDNYVQTLNEKGILVSKKFQSGTIVMTIAANIGDTAILKREMYLTDSVVGIETELSELYLELFFKSIKVQLDNTATQSAQKNINIEKLNEVLVKYPTDRTEQDKISKKYLFIHSLLKDLEIQLSKLQSIKTGLMQDLLSGKVRVNHLTEETANA